MSIRKPRILFVGEAVTLAHIARPYALARSLDAEQYEIHLACHPRYTKLFPNKPFVWHSLHSIPSERFLGDLKRGKLSYDSETLRCYIQEDMRLISDIAPDLIVSDFRLSLAISAPATKTPYAAIINAYWSPYARQRFPLPELAVTRWIGVRLAQLLYRLMRPAAFARCTLPFNRLRREYGLRPIGFDLRRIFTYADYTLYTDVPDLVPTFGLPGNHIYLGPILWSPEMPLPEWWEKVPGNRPIIYVTMGSSGEGRLLKMVLQALADLPVSVLAATAGRIKLETVPRNVFMAEYLPGQECSLRADVVICNGGSPTTQQALTAGKPILGIASNTDQFLNMEAIRQAGAGELLSADTFGIDCIRAILMHLLTNPTYRHAAKALSIALSRYSTSSRFSEFLANVLGKPSACEDSTLETVQTKNAVNTLREQ